MATHGNVVSEAIREIRAATGENQTQFASRIGVAVATLARYETGKQRPEVTILDKLQNVAIASDLKKSARVLADEVSRVAQAKQQKTKQKEQGLRERVKALRACLQTSMEQSQSLFKRVVRAHEKDTFPVDLDLNGLAERIKSMVEDQSAIVQELRRWEKTPQGASTEGSDSGDGHIRRIS